MCCLFSRLENTSTHKQDQDVASEMIDKRVTRKSLRFSYSSSTAMLHNRVSNINSVSSASSTIKSKPKHGKEVYFKRRSKPKKKKDHSLQRTLKGVNNKISSNGKVLRSAPTG